MKAFVTTYISGFITSYDTTFAMEPMNEVSRVILNCVDGFRLLNNISDRPTVPG
jgi:hypothetical protein